MAKLDLTGLMTGLPTDQDLRTQGQARAAQIQGGGLGSNLARGIASRAPQREEMMRQGLGGMFGVDTRTGDQQQTARMQQALSGLDLDTPEGLMQLAKIQQSTGDMTGAAQSIAAARALTLSTASNKKNVEDKRLQGEVVKEYALQNLTPEQYEKLTPALNKGVIPLETIKSFVKKAGKRTPKNFTYTNTAGNRVVEAVWLDDEGNSFDESGSAVVLPADAQLTTTGKTEGDITDLNISPFSNTAATKVQDKLSRARLETNSLSSLVDDDFDNYLSFKGSLKAKAGEFLSRMTGLGGEALNQAVEGATAEDLIMFSGEKSLMFAKLESFFNTRRKEITGAAAAVAELKMLRASILNGDVSPEEGRVKVQEYIDRANAYTDELSQQLKQGGLDITGGLSASKLEAANAVRNLLQQNSSQEDVN
jgi:hypothetical protein